MRPVQIGFPGRPRRASYPTLYSTSSTIGKRRGRAVPGRRPSPIPSSDAGRRVEYALVALARTRRQFRLKIHAE